MIDKGFEKRKFNYFLRVCVFFFIFSCFVLLLCCVGNRAKGISCLKTERNSELLKGIENGGREKSLKTDLKKIFIQTV